MSDSKKTILIVDDAPINLKYAKGVLEADYNIVMAKSGRNALDYLKNHIPDLILLDIIMPELDGFETYNIIKENPMTKDIPVVFLTADQDRACEVKGFRMGAMDFITKPFEPEIMRYRVERILQLYALKKDLQRQVAIKTEEAQKDILTGLYNRRFVEKEVDAYLSVEGRKGVLFIIDMDNFKGVNDTFGHITGDAVLVRFSEYIKRLIRSDDIACRIGGDEFILFFPGAISKDFAAMKAQALIDAYEETVAQTKTGAVESGISVGITFAPRDGLNFMSLYKNADRALYYVKENGKKNYHFYKETESYEFVERNVVVNTETDINQLVRLVKEDKDPTGAFEIEYDGFRNIYQFLSRCISRTHQSIQLVLMSVYNTSGGSIAPEVMAHSMQLLGDCIKESLRKGDVATEFSSSQFVVLLLDTDEANASMVVERIIEKHYSREYDNGQRVKYDIRQLK